MNCRPGELAFIVGLREQKAMNGRIVECIEIVSPHARCIDPVGRPHRSNGNQTMLIKATGAPLEGRTITGTTMLHPYVLCPLKNLRPIRNDPGQDETLTWLDVPTTDKAAA